MIMFINRKEELGKLNEIAMSKRAELVLVYGRRRIGKSRLLVEFQKNTNALYLLADISENILDILAKQIGEDFVKFGSWDDFFEYIYKSKHKIIIVDEFQYIYQINKAWPTVLQRWWEKIKETDKKIILCGSIISTIYKISMGYGSALYGRKTFEMQIEPIKFRFIKHFFPAYNFEQLVEAYSILGGVPRYLEEFESKLSIYKNIEKKILDKTAFLYNEPHNLLFEEFRTPAPYVSILTAITQGYVKFGEIAETSKIQSHKLPKYLLVLERVGLIKKEFPVTEKKLKTKMTRYRVKDNFYGFWFKFLFKNKSFIEQGLQSEVLDSIKKDFNSYVGAIFEDVCKEFIIDSKVLNVAKIGKWWHKDKEVDIVALNENNNLALFVECKWQERVDTKKVLEELKEKTISFPQNKKMYSVIAKSFKNKFSEPDVLLFEINDLKKLLFNKNKK